MVWYQAEVAGTIIVQTLPVIRHLVRDESAQKSLISVHLNEIHTTRSSKVWDGSDLERGSAGHETESFKSGRRVPYLDPIRASWSTFTPIKRQI